MKCRLIMLAMPLLCAGIARGQDDAATRIAERVRVPLATLPQLKEAPPMNAAPDFKGWAGPLAFQDLWGHSRKLPVETRGYLAADGQDIYLAVRCEDPAAKEIASAPVPLDGDVWAGDCAEFMLLPGYDPTQPYYHFAMNPAGSLYDAKGKDKAWNSGAKVFTAVDDKGWLAVIRVPLESLGMKKDAPPALWRINLHRSRPARAANLPEDLAWSPTRCGQNHVPWRFGIVTHVNGRPPEAAELETWMKNLPTDTKTAIPQAIPEPRPMAESLSWKATADEIAKMPSRELLAGLPGAGPAEKAARIQALYDKVAFSPSGLMYSMLRLEDGEVRPFEPGDFKDSSFIKKLKIDGAWEYLHGENSITHAGIYLAAQAYRIEAEDTPAARAEAAKAFRSLELVYEMGVKAGKPGWMCKPYGFRPSDQTSPDQYVDACWGLYAYHKVASTDHQRKIEQMVVAFADYWRSVNYTLDYFGKKWDFGSGGGYANAKLILINALALHFTGKEVYRNEVKRFVGRADWVNASAVTLWRARLEQEKREGRLAAHNETPMQFVTPLLKPGEVLFWEQAVLCKFVAVTAEILQEIQPDLLGDRLPIILEEWWEQGRYGLGDDLLPHYWFAADFLNGTWRPLPNSPDEPRDKWVFGDPFMASTTQVRWNDPLARLIVTSVIASRHAPAIAERAAQQARAIMEAMDETHLHWLLDLDGKQLRPEIRYYGQCLDSEMGASFLVAYWRGRKDGLWK